jgi:hypothetical protein
MLRIALLSLLLSTAVWAGQVGGLPCPAGPPTGTRDAGSQADRCLAGLARFARESGLQCGRRGIWGGRGDARARLFLAAQSAASSNTSSRLFYERLVGRGKSKTAALATVARKLLISINAMRDQRPCTRGRGRTQLLLGSLA